VLDNASLWKSAGGIAIGKYENGVASLGELTQGALESGISGAYATEMRRQISAQREITVRLSTNIKASAKELARLQQGTLKHAGYDPLRKTVASGIAKGEAALAAERQALAKKTASAGVRNAVLSKGIPLVFLAADALSEYNDWYSVTRQLDRTR
jgi:hypothetical protein